MVSEEQLNDRVAHPHVGNDFQDWFTQFIKHLEFNTLDAAGAIQFEHRVQSFPLVVVQAVFQTLQDAGLSTEEVLAMFGQSMLEREHDQRMWSPELNHRRFELIDKEIQGDLNAAERLELLGLTRLMRQHVDSELSLPIEGAVELHRKLSDLHARPGGPS